MSHRHLGKLLHKTSCLHRYAAAVSLLLISAVSLAAEDPPSNDPVPSTIMVDFLKARSMMAPVIECREQDYPVFGVDVKVFNLGPNINSGYSDYNPVLDKKESFMLFTSRRPLENGEERDVDGQYFEKMMVSRRKNGVFQEAQPISSSDSLFGRLPTSDRHESLIFLSYSEDLLITYTDEKLYYSNRVGEFYTEPVEFPKIINKGKWKRHASITEDGRTLYFTTESQSTVSKNLNLDIWEIERKDDGSWKRPRRLSDVVNSPYNEDSPEISPDGRFLFFSSNRFGGLGGYDVYMAEKVDGEWQEPKNLCQPINTPADDIYFKLSRNGNYAYYSSNALGGEGNMDIYKVVLDVPSIATCGSYAYGRRNITFTSPFSIEFYGEGKEFFWAFGDGQTGVGTSITHEYAADGDYQVVLYVREKSSQRVVNTVFSKKVRVDTENSAVDIIGPDTAELGHEFHFDGSESYVEGQPATAYYWKVDGQLISREPEINYEFTRVGRHKVELEVGVLDERIMELSSACIAREVEVITPFEYARTVGAQKGSEGFSYSEIIPDQVLYDLGVKQEENELSLENDYIKTWQDEAKSFSAFENDRAPGISLDKLINVTSPSNGTVKVKNANYGLLVYEPKKGFSGYDKFSYSVRSRDGRVASATVVVSVMQRVGEMRGQNVTNDEVEIGSEDAVKIFPLQNDEHDLGAKQSIVDFTQPSAGVVQQLGLQGLIEYSPTASFQGTDAFTYTVEDEEGRQSTASVVIRSKDVTKAKLYANPDYVEIKQGEKARVKVYDNDVYKGSVNIVGISEPKHGSSRVINPLNGDIYYGPDPDFVGTDAFTYTIEDEEGKRSATSVTVVVRENLQTDKPLVLETTQGTPVNAFIFDEFNIPTGYELAGKVNAKNGKAEVIDSKRGIVKYAPNKDFAGFEMFYVDVEDQENKLKIGVIVKVKAVQSLMEKYGISTNALFINVNGRTIIDVRKFDYSKLSEDEVMIAIQEAFDAAKYLNESEVAFSYESLDKEQYAITYQVEDDEGNLSAGSFMIYPTDELGIPIVTRMVLNSDLIKTKINTPSTLLPMINDRHLKGQKMRLMNVSKPMNGTMVMDEVKGSVMYIPNLDFHGTDAFTYTVEDESGIRSTTAVNVVVLNEVEYALEEQGYNPRLKAYDYVALEPDEQFLKPEKVIDATNGLFGNVEVTNAYTGEIQYMPKKGFSGEDRFSFTLQHTDGSMSAHSVLAVTDKRNEFVEGTRTIDGRVTLYADESMYFYGLINKMHPEGKDMRLVDVQSERRGTTSIIGGSAFAYKPIAGFTGLDKVTFTVIDEQGNMQKNEAFIEVKDPELRMDREMVRFETPVNLPLEISLKGEVKDLLYHDHTQPASGSLTLESKDNLLFKYDAAKEGDVDEFRVALRSASDQVSYIDVVIEVKPAVDMALDAPEMKDFNYEVESDPRTSLVSVSQGRKGAVNYDAAGKTISYDPYAAAVGKDVVSYIVELADGSIAQRKLEVVHVDHKTFDENAQASSKATIAGNAPVLIYAFSNMRSKDRLGAVIDKVKNADEGDVRILDAERGIIEFTPKAGTTADVFTYRIENAQGKKQDVTVGFDIRSTRADEQKILTITAARGYKAFSYGVLDYIEEKKLKFLDVSGGVLEDSDVDVLDPKTGVFSYTSTAPVGSEDILIVEAIDEAGVVVQIPVRIKVVDQEAYSAANLTYNNISSVESNKDSYHTVLGMNEKGSRLIRVANARAGQVSILDADQGIARYSPYPGFVGEDAYVFEYTDEEGNIFQKQMKVIVRDESAKLISMSEIRNQSQEIEERVTNLSQDLAQAQQETMANLGDEDSEEVQRAIEAQKEQLRLREERLRKQREEEARLARLEEQRKAKEEAKAEEIAQAEAKAKAEQEAKEEAKRLAQLESDQKKEEALAQAEEKAQKEASERERKAKEAARKKEQERLAEAKRLEEEKKPKQHEKLVHDAPWIAQQAQEKLDEITEQKAAESDVVVFRNIHFDFDKSDLRLLSEQELDKIYQYMVDNPEYELQLDGHTDWIGTVEYNLALSERRAKQAYEYLTKKGIAEGRMNYQFYGEAIPIAPNVKPDGSDDPVGRQLNRRCEFEVKESGTSSITLKF